MPDTAISNVDAAKFLAISNVTNSLSMATHFARRSLTIVERRQLQNREKAVMTTEECFIAYAEKVSGFQRVTELEMERGQGSRQTGDSKNANSGKNQDKGGADSGDEADDEGD